MHRDTAGWDCIKATNGVFAEQEQPGWLPLSKILHLIPNSVLDFLSQSSYHFESRLSWNVFYPSACFSTG